MTANPANVPALPFRFTVALGDRVLIGALAALVVARPLVYGDDPGRLRLTTTGGSVSLNLGVWLVLLGFAGWRIVVGQSIRWRGTLPAAALAGVGVAAMWSSRREGVYQRPGEHIAWDWLTLAAAFFVARQLTGRAADRRGFLNVLLAGAVSIASIGMVQRFGPALGVPSTEAVILDARPDLVGSEEFQPQLNAATTATGLVHGTLESPEAYLIFLLMALPVALVTSLAAGNRFKVALPVLLIAGVLALFAGSLFSGSVATSISEGFRLFREHPMWGTGPGNFSRMAADGNLASGSAWLTLAASMGGIAAMLALIAFVPVEVLRRSAVSDTEEPISGTRWEFYLGGIGGLLIGFVASVAQMPSEAPVWEVYNVGGFAIGRGVVWLVAFGILEQLRPSPRLLSRAVACSVVVVLLAGFFTEAALSQIILFTTVILLALLAASRDELVSANIVEKPWMRPVAVSGAVLAASVIVCYVLLAAGPAWQTAEAVRKSRTASRFYPDIERQIDLGKGNIDRANARHKTINFLNYQVLNPLRAAAEKDPNNATLLLEISRWERPLWRQLLHADPKEAPALGKDILFRADKAAKLDPRNIAGEQAVLEALILYRKESNSKPGQRLEAFNNHLKAVAFRLPELEVPYRYRMVSTLLATGDSDGVEPEIAKLLRLNRAEGQPHGKLSDSQRREIIEQAKQVIKKPPQELLDEWIDQ
ncbi:tetratricopeptide repeat protein [Zavarzinella formosa]|uniref:hypothetical protein n=1 Tax=Zavarzinella formosa TaxID=360055 RepID=UPI0002EACF79|nr:hypothetical protein [Zavarzinella formosa]